MPQPNIEFHAGVAYSDDLGFAFGPGLRLGISSHAAFSVAALLVQRTYVGSETGQNNDLYVTRKELLQLGIPVTIRARPTDAFPLFATVGVAPHLLLSRKELPDLDYVFLPEGYDDCELNAVIGVGAYYGSFLAQLQFNLPLTDPFPRPPYDENDPLAVTLIELTVGISL